MPPPQQQWPQQQPRPAAPPQQVPPAAPYYQQPPYQPAGRAAATRPLSKLRTSFDIICGIIFLVLGLGLLVYFIFSIVQSAEQIGLVYDDLFSGLFGYYMSSDTAVYYILSTFVVSITNVIWIVGAILLTLAGVFSLTSGRGRKPAIAALPFMLLGLVGDILTIVMIVTSAPVALGRPLDLWGEVIMPALLIYIVEIVAIAAVCVLLPLKKKAKKKAVQGQGPAPYPAAPPVYGQPVAPAAVPPAAPTAAAAQPPVNAASPAPSPAEPPVSAAQAPPAAPEPPKAPEAIPPAAPPLSEPLPATPQAETAAPDDTVTDISPAAQDTPPTNP
ncbi:MAG: hypothetical protein GXY32_06740 [Ruminococcaceae bacterium]|nr:hypothetical protein [Oscillospiraceae bacterium]